MKTVRANWRQTILICRKCGKKAGGGFGAKGRTMLARALREQLGIGKGRKADVGIVEVGCLKICPKRAVMVVDGSHPRAWLAVATGTPLGEVAERLGLAGDAVEPA